MVWPFRRKPAPVIPGPPGVPKAMGATKNQKPTHKDWVKLGEQIDEDPDFRLGRLTIFGLIQSTEITIEGAGEDPRAIALAEHLTTLWYETLPHLLNAFIHGYAAFELVNQYDHTERLHTLELEYLTPRNGGKATRIDDNGEFGGVEYKIGSGDPVTLNPTESWWFGMDATGLDPWGHSRYEGAAYKVYLEKSEADKNWKIYTAKFANGKFFAKAPRRYPATGTEASGGRATTNEPGDPSNPMDDVANQWNATESGGIMVVSSEVDAQNNPLFSGIELQQQPNPQPLESRSAALRDAALGSIGVPARAVAQDSSVGSLALAQTHLTVLYATVTGIMDQLVTSFQETPVEHLLKRNYPANARPPLVVTYAKLSPELVALVIGIVDSTIKSGTASPWLTEGVIDFGQLLDIAGLPVGDNLPARLAAVKAASVPAPAPGGFQFRLANAPAVLDKDDADIDARYQREASSMMAEVYRILDSGADMVDGRIAGLNGNTRRRL